MNLSTAINTALIVFLLTLMTFVGPLLDDSLDQAPTEAEVAEAIAADLQDAKIEAWVAKAKEANPYLSEHDLSRVRATAMHLEGMRP